MRIVVQNVKEAHLSISNKRITSIQKGYVLLVGFKDGDEAQIVGKMIDKILKMRVFQDGDGKTNLAVGEVDGEILAVPQFTLYADLANGRRPSFTKALNPLAAEKLFLLFIEELSRCYPRVFAGIFGADMQVNLTNDGPFTLVLDSEELFHI
ncbi:MAG: D-aminoacyl-tRNA deacylase [Bacilli bacterium]|jgi:D-tyrosyl-tRNA(Tyr) deacylase